VQPTLRAWRDLAVLAFFAFIASNGLSIRGAAVAAVEPDRPAGSAGVGMPIVLSGVLLINWPIRRRIARARS
jgi:hypothetical protein